MGPWKPGGRCCKCHTRMDRLVFSPLQVPQMKRRVVGAALFLISAHYLHAAAVSQEGMYQETMLESHSWGCTTEGREKSGRTWKLYMKGTQTQLVAVLSLTQSRLAEPQEQQDLQRQQKQLPVDAPLALVLGQQLKSYHRSLAQCWGGPQQYLVVTLWAHAKPLHKLTGQQRPDSGFGTSVVCCRPSVIVPSSLIRFLPYLAHPAPILKKNVLSPLHNLTNILYHVAFAAAIKVKFLPEGFFQLLTESLSTSSSWSGSL